MEELAIDEVAGVRRPLSAAVQHCLRRIAKRTIADPSWSLSVHSAFFAAKISIGTIGDRIYGYATSERKNATIALSTASIKTKG